MTRWIKSRPGRARVACITFLCVPEDEARQFPAEPRRVDGVEGRACSLRAGLESRLALDAIKQPGASSRLHPSLRETEIRWGAV
jgi:hypothetical protein